MPLTSGEFRASLFYSYPSHIHTHTVIHSTLPLCLPAHEWAVVCFESIIFKEEVRLVSFLNPQMRQLQGETVPLMYIELFCGAGY